MHCNKAWCTPMVLNLLTTIDQIVLSSSPTSNEDMKNDKTRWIVKLKHIEMANGEIKIVWLKNVQY